MPIEQASVLCCSERTELSTSWLSSCHKVACFHNRGRFLFLPRLFFRCQLLPANHKMDRWREDGERKWRHYHVGGKQDRPRGQKVTCSSLLTNEIIDCCCQYGVPRIFPISYLCPSLPSLSLFQPTLCNNIDERFKLINQLWRLMFNLKASTV